MQVRSPARCPSRWIGDDLEACSPVPRGDAEQLELRGPLPTADAGADASSDPGTGPGGWGFGGHATTPISGCGGGPRTSLASARLGTEPATVPSALRVLLDRRRDRERLGCSPGAAPAGSRVRRLVGAYVDPPPGQPGRQPRVLALLADRQRQLVVGYHDTG